MIRRAGLISVLVGLALAAPAIGALKKGRSERGIQFSAAMYETHLRYLAADERQGRGIGTRGIDEAADYIAGRFEELGLRGGGDRGSFFQKFDVSVSRRIADTTLLTFKGGQAHGRRGLKVNDEFIPLPFSAHGGFDGRVAFVGYGIGENDEHKYNDYKGVDVKNRVALMLRFEPPWWDKEKGRDPSVPNRSRFSLFSTKAEQAMEHGAAAVLIVNPVPTEGDEDVLFDFSSGHSVGLDLPMVQITRKAADELLAAGGLPPIGKLQKKIDASRKPVSALLRGVRVNGFVGVEKVRTPVKNVIGVVRGHGPAADEYVVVGAHYDHLGIATNWRKPSDTHKYIHNGADDNGSGTTGLLMLADALHHGEHLKRSVILIAFTGEESGLLGSKYWVEHPTVRKDHVVAMLNMDMIGRLKDDVLLVGGMKTGKGFEKMVRGAADAEDLKLRSAGGGRGPSDHSAFYGADIPVLFFFTGMHPQYHSPDDDVDLINFTGACRVLNVVYDCLKPIADAPKRPEFHRDATRFRPDGAGDEETSASADKKKSDRDLRRGGKTNDPHRGGGDDEAPPMPRVRLGIAPANYGEAEGRGFPIEYVTAGGAAEKAGLRDKDRILTIGGKAIRDVYGYMNVLSKYKPGDEIEIVVLRGKKEMKFRVKLEGAKQTGRE